MRSTIRCCKDCTVREIGCHATCEIYKGEKEKYLEEKNKVSDAIKFENDMKDSVYHAVKRMKNRRGVYYGKK